MKLLRDLFTGAGNAHWELGRIGFAFSLLSGTTLAGIALAFKDQAFSLADFGTGIGLIAAGFAAYIGAKELSNPANRRPPATIVEGDIQQADVAGDLNVGGGK